MIADDQLRRLRHHVDRAIRPVRDLLGMAVAKLKLSPPAWPVSVLAVAYPRRSAATIASRAIAP